VAPTDRSPPHGLIGGPSKSRVTARNLSEDAPLAFMRLRAHHHSPSPPTPDHRAQESPCDTSRRPLRRD